MHDGPDEAHTMASEQSMTTMSSERFDNTTEYYIIYYPYFDQIAEHIVSYIIGGLAFPTLPLLTAIMSTKKYRNYSYSLYLAIMSVYDFFHVIIYFINNILWQLSPNYINTLINVTAVCKLFGHIKEVSPIVSLWLNVALAIDRFIVITFPFKKETWCNRRNSWILSMGILLVIHGSGIMYFVAFFIGYSWSYGKDICGYDSKLRLHMLHLRSTVGTFLSVILIIVFTAISIVQLFRIRRKRLDMTSGDSGKGKDKTSRASVPLVVIGVSVVVTQLPFIGMELQRSYLFQLIDGIPATSYTMLELQLVMIFRGLYYFVNVNNFFILFILNGTFRRDLYNMLTCKEMVKKR